VAEPEPNTVAEEAARMYTLVGSAQALFENGQSLLDAELAFQKARATFVFSRAKGILGLAALALALLFFALMALVMGLLLVLSPLIGPLWAVCVVVGGLLVTTALCILGVIQRVKAVSKAIKGPAKPGDPA
jgi:hypothetical protein